MAMRPRGGRANIPNRAPRLIVGRVYEQFKPMSEWRQENDYDTLLVYLPGFQKEYIKVTTEDLNIVRVRGERLMADNKWSRFQEDYRVPENCEMRGIRARFDVGILTITMPRKITNSPPLPPPTTSATQAAPEQPFTGAKQEEALPNAKGPKRKKADKPETTPLEANINAPLPPPPPPPTTRTHAAPKTDQEQGTKQEEALPDAKKEAKEKKPDKPQTTSLEAKTLPPQPTPASSSTTKQEPLKPTPEADEVVHFTIGSLPPKKDKQGVVEKPGVGGKTDLDKGKGKEAFLEGKTRRDLEASKGKPNDEGAVGSSFRVGKQEENKVGIGRRGMVTMNEDRKALVNVGVGILVIVALGVQVSYTIGLIGKGK